MSVASRSGIDRTGSCGRTGNGSQQPLSGLRFRFEFVDDVGLRGNEPPGDQTDEHQTCETDEEVDAELDSRVSADDLVYPPSDSRPWGAP